MLTAEQQTTLLRIAREAIASQIDQRQPAIDPAALDETLREPAGVFVTLRTRDHDLRGCIGSVVPVDPLWQAVARSAANAAFRDPRFPPISKAELAEIGLEISVMGPLEPVSSIDEIALGRDGLIISRGRSAGLLLPQVATEHGWDRATFLRHACLKAGLPADAWRVPGTKIDRFSAYVFGE